MFSVLCADDTPMVRRAAAKALGVSRSVLDTRTNPSKRQPMAKSVAANPSQHNILISDFIQLYRKLSTDDQDSVRLLTIPDLIALASNLSPPEVKEYLLDCVRASVSDKSWRVRYMVANEFNALAGTVGDNVIREELVGAFISLLKDNEAEVRAAAAGQIPGELCSRWLDRVLR